MPACCPPNSWPQLLRSKEELNKDDAPDAPKGSIVTVKTSTGANLDLYVVSPTGTSKGAIMVFPDIYSVRVLTTQVRSGDRIGAICDALADAGYTVALAGIFGDQPFDLAIKGPDDGDYEKFDSFAQDGGVDWFKAQNYESMAPKVKACASYLKEKTGGQAIGVLGFCFGTWLLSKTSACGDVDYACAVGCHPATVLESAVFGGDEVGMMNSLQQPTRFLWAGNDSDIYKDAGAGKVALTKSGGDVVEFPEMLHGWVSRGDVADETVKKNVETAINCIMEFFDEKMPKVE